MLFEARGYSKTFYEWYKNLSFEKIKEIAEEYPASFIRGFFQSEGSITKDGRVFMANTDSQIADIVRCVLNKLGFRSSYYPSSHQIYILGGRKSMRRFLSVMRLGCQGVYADAVNPTKLREEIFQHPAPWWWNRWR